MKYLRRFWPWLNTKYALRSEIEALLAKIAKLEAALQRVSDFDPDGTRPCEIAREALSGAGNKPGTPA